MFFFHHHHLKRLMRYGAAARVTEFTSTLHPSLPLYIYGGYKCKISYAVELLFQQQAAIFGVCFAFVFQMARADNQRKFRGRNFRVTDF